MPVRGFFYIQTWVVLSFLLEKSRVLGLLCHLHVCFRMRLQHDKPGPPSFVSGTPQYHPDAAPWGTIDTLSPRVLRVERRNKLHFLAPASFSFAKALPEIGPLFIYLFIYSCYSKLESCHFKFRIRMLRSRTLLKIIFSNLFL